NLVAVCADRWIVLSCYSRAYPCCGGVSYSPCYGMGSARQRRALHRSRECRYWLHPVSGGLPGRGHYSAQEVIEEGREFFTPRYSLNATKPAIMCCSDVVHTR